MKGKGTHALLQRPAPSVSVDFARPFMEMNVGVLGRHPDWLEVSLGLVGVDSHKSTIRWRYVPQGIIGVKIR